MKGSREGDQIKPDAPKTESAHFTPVDPSAGKFENPDDADEAPFYRKLEAAKQSSTDRRSERVTAPERFQRHHHSDEPLRPIRVIRKKDLPDYCGLQRTVIEAMIAAGQFPKPIKLNDSGRAIAWLETEIAAWQQARIAKRDAEAKQPSAA